MDEQVNTVTVGNAGRALPGLVSRSTLESQLASHGAYVRPSPAELKKKYEQESLEPDNVFKASGEAGVGILNVMSGKHLAGKQVEEVGGKDNPLAKADQAGIGVAEKAEKKVEEVVSWSAELGKLLSAESLKRFGLIVAGALLLMFAALMLVHAMGGPTPIPIPV